MNYIDITQPNQTLNINLNYSGLFVNSDLGFYIHKDGSDSEGEEFGCPVEDNGYYHTITIPSHIIEALEDETQYNINAINYYDDDRIIYRGKFQTTSKDILDYSINENKYTQKTNSTNYTILD